MLTGTINMAKDNTATSFPLTFAARGQTVILAEIRAGDKLRRRLADLGLTIGMQVRIVQEDASGPVILAVKHDSRLAVGRGMAQKIMVSSIEGDA